MTKETIKNAIIKYLESQGGHVMGGVLERVIGDEMACKASNVSRRCRELVQAGQIEVSKVQIDGKGPWVTRYRALENYPLVQVALM